MGRVVGGNLALAIALAIELPPLHVDVAAGTRAECVDDAVRDVGGEGRRGEGRRGAAGDAGHQHLDPVFQVGERAEG